jgi:hypothetical protein
MLCLAFATIEGMTILAQQTMPVTFDEFGYYFGGHNDSLKEDLRKIDGVPNATYFVKDGQVFVFDKLVQLVEEHRKLQPGLPLVDLARGLIAEATVSAKEAVETYLLGKVAGRQHEQDTAKEVGQWVAYALLRGDALAAALAFGRAAALYDSAISRLARRIAESMRFVAENKKATELNGRAITTMMDMLRMGR